VNVRWTLPAALDIRGPELVAFVGGGGKTSLMFALAAALPGRVVITTTTRIFAAQMRLAPALVYADDLSPLAGALAAHGRCLVVGRVEGDKAHGVDPNLPARLLARPDVDYVLVEADGSRMQPVKAPAGHEPVIPPETTLVVPVAGMDALEGPLEAVAHRAEIVKRLTNYELRTTKEEGRTTNDQRPLTPTGWLTPNGLARVLTHEAGGLKGVPDGARVVPWLNKVETDERLARARAAARLMLGEPRVARVVLGAARTAEPAREVWRRVSAVVLAAGESRRMGANKLLLPWDVSPGGLPMTVLGQTLAHVLASGAHEIIVISGHEQAAVAAAVSAMPEMAATSTTESAPADEKAAVMAGTDTIAGNVSLRVVHNPDYANGMLTSVQAAVRSLTPVADAILVVLGDQPLVTPATIDRLLAAYAASPDSLVAPTHRGARGNPVLIDRRHFAELLALPPDAAPRVLLQRHPDDLLLVEVEDAGVLHDLDYPDDYARRRPKP